MNADTLTQMTTINAAPATALSFGEELKFLIMGDITPAFYIAGLFFAALGAFLYKVYKVRTRKVEAKDSPRPFSPLFFLKHNGPNLLVTAMTILTMIRFYPDIVKKINPEFVKAWGAMDMLILLLLGVFFDVIIEWILWKIFKGRYKILAETNKEVVFQIGSINDKVEQINGVDYEAISVEQLAEQNEAFRVEFYNGAPVLCTDIARTIPLIKGNFISEKGVPYTLKSINNN